MLIRTCGLIREQRTAEALTRGHGQQGPAAAAKPGGARAPAEEHGAAAMPGAAAYAPAASGAAAGVSAGAAGGEGGLAQAGDPVTDELVSVMSARCISTGALCGRPADLAC